MAPIPTPPSSSVASAGSASAEPSVSGEPSASAAASPSPSTSANTSGQQVSAIAGLSVAAASVAPSSSLLLGEEGPGSDDHLSGSGGGGSAIGTATATVSSLANAVNATGTTNPAVLLKYQDAAETIGKHFVSKASTTSTFKPSGDARVDFLADHYHFMCEIGCPFKLRRIGGGELDVHGLYRAVLDRGGLQSVIFNRAFKMVAKTLHLPKTCTSAAFILRSEYEKLLYAYEQKHVWGRSVSEIPPLVQSDRRKSVPLRTMPLRHRNSSTSSMAAATATATPTSFLESAMQPPAPPPSLPQQPMFSNSSSSNAGGGAGGGANAAGINNSNEALHALHQPNTNNTHNSSNTTTPGTSNPAWGGIHSTLTGGGAASGTRSRRQAAQAVSNAVAAAAVTDDPFAYPYVPRRLGVGSGVIEHGLTAHEEQIVEDELFQLSENHPKPHPIFVPGQASERERVVACLQSPLHDDNAWALGTLNALSFDSQNVLTISEFGGLLEALHAILERYMEDALGKRKYGVRAGGEDEGNLSGGRGPPKVTYLPALDVRMAGDHGMQRRNGGIVSRPPQQQQEDDNDVTMTPVDVNQNISDEYGRNPSLQHYKGLFNVVDPIAVDREQCAVVAANILRNMSFYDRNAISLANSKAVMALTADMIEHIGIVANLRDSLMDMWINVSPYLDANEGHAGHAVLTCCIRLLDPFKEGADMARFTNCGEVLARLAASPDRNERAMTNRFDIMLPRLVDMLGGRQRKYVNAGLAALCNLSAFDWPARDEIARVPRALDRLVVMLADAELAPRAAVTLLNLAESPSNRSVLMVFERRLAELALTASPAADTVCSILFALEYD